MDNILELLKKHNINGGDLNHIYYLCIANKKDEAIRYIRPKTEYDHKIAETIVNWYLKEQGSEIEEVRNRLENYRAEQLIQQTQNIPKCPTCQSTSLSKITNTKKAVKIGLFGIFGAIDDAGKTWKCNSCGSTW